MDDEAAGADAIADRGYARRPTDSEGRTALAAAERQPETRPQRQAGATNWKKWLAAALFLLSFGGSVLFCISYVLFPIPNSSLGGLPPDLSSSGVPTAPTTSYPLGSDLGWMQNHLLGAGLGTALLALGIGLLVVVRHLMPPVYYQQQRKPYPSPAADELAAEDAARQGVVASGLGRSTLLRRTLLGALAILPLPFAFAMRDLGPRRDSLLERDSWYKGARLINIDNKEPMKLGGLDLGGFVTVMPEGYLDTTVPINAESVALLIRLDPGLIQPLPGQEDWSVQGYVCYSKICTHAGCPAACYLQKSHWLLCPCHQSTFDVTRGCDVVFGPAPHRLPQLPIYVDSDGYFRARAGFPFPPGPPFWRFGGAQ